MDLLILFFSNLLYIIIFCFTICKVYPLKSKEINVYTAFIVIFSGIICGLVDYYMKPFIKDIVVFFTFLILSNTLFVGKQKNNTILSLMFILIIAMMDLIVETVINYESKYIFRWDNLEIWSKIIIVAIESTVLFLASKVITTFSRKNFRYTKNWCEKLSILVPIISIIIYAIMFDILIESNLEAHFINLIIAVSMLVFLINILIYVIIYSTSAILEKNVQLASKKMKESQEAKYIRMYMKRDLDERKFFHDVKKHFNAIRYLAEKEKIREIIDLIDSLFNDISKIDSMQYTLNPIINSILSEKKYRAEKIGLKKFEINIDKSTDFSFIENRDLITIFSNILDNAIEASYGIDDSYIILNVKNKYPMNGIFIEIENKYENEIIVWGDMYKSTKNGDLNVRRGFGLDNVKDSVNK